MRTVRQLLESKSVEIHAVPPDAPVIEAIRLMAEKGVGAVLVMRGEELAGILSERDYARKIALMGRRSGLTLVREVMTSPVMFVGPSNTSEECMALMTESRTRHLPVVDDGRLLGLISIGDLVKNIISEQQFVIDQLEHYITGHRG